jgi:uncharacterized YigZ family protein
MNGYPVPADQYRQEILVVNSRFIATLAPAGSVEEAKTFIAKVKHEFADASHNVPAYVVGFGASVTAHCSDDGEPPGTAGKPALAVLSGSGLGDAAVVVTRYFGGTKLGTGGLVRAYGDAVRAVTGGAPRALKTRLDEVMVEFPYRYLERLRLLVTVYQGWLVDEAFTDQVVVTARFKPEDLPGFQRALQDLTNGGIQAVVIQTKDFLLPVT